MSDDVKLLDAESTSMAPTQAAVPFPSQAGRLLSSGVDIRGSGSGNWLHKEW